MSTITINPALELTFGMPTSGYAVAAGTCTAAWPIPAAGATTVAVVRTHALSQGEVAFDAKRRTSKGSSSWRSPDC
jgi:hypothetical protein